MTKFSNPHQKSEQSTKMKILHFEEHVFLLSIFASKVWFFVFFKILCKLDFLCKYVEFETIGASNMTKDDDSERGLRQSLRQSLATQMQELYFWRRNYFPVKCNDLSSKSYHHVINPISAYLYYDSWNNIPCKKTI